MGLLDWVKRRGMPDSREPDKAPDINNVPGLGISPIWQPEPYKERSSRYLVQPCVGWSEKGYHAGLAVAAPNGETATHWGAASPNKSRAMCEAYSAFSGWLENHEARLDHAKEPRRKLETER